MWIFNCMSDWCPNPCVFQESGAYSSLIVREQQAPKGIIKGLPGSASED